MTPRLAKIAGKLVSIPEGRRIKRRDLYRLALICAVAIVILNTILAATSLRRVFIQEDWLLHTQKVISASEQLAARIRSSESSARGYVLTGSPSFEDQYKMSAQRVQESIKNVEQLTIDSAVQQKNLSQLRTRIAAKMTVLDDLIAERHGHPSGAIDAELIAGVVNDTPNRDQDVMATIRVILAEENRLLEIRTEDFNIAKREVWVTFILAFLLDFVLLIVAFEFLIRLNIEREVIERNSEQIASLNDQLQLANTELETRVEQRTRELAFSNQELEAFSYSVSHDLRAPLRTIDGFSLALQEDFSDKLNAEGRDYITRVRAGVQRMGTLIDALLQLSRVTRSELQAEDVDLSQLAGLVFQELAASDTERSVTFSAQPDVHVRGDGRLLRIALENLLGNAWKFTSKTEHPRIEFGSRPGEGADTGKTVYFIQDNGAGFDMQYVDRLFTAFQRLHGDRDFKGSGIGLATVSRIIRRHHGTIGATSEPGHGATFTFSLAE
jgi:signal transduction histidine kinase